MRKLNRTDIENILLGCTILGTGGGGPLENGLALIDEALAAGKEFVLASFDEVSPDTYIGTPYGCGAISPLTEEDIKKYERLPLPEKSPYLIAMENVERVIGRPLDAVISTELGGENTACAFYTAAMTDRFIMDGDPAGRSVPCLQHSTYYLDGIPMCPMAVTNDFGESAVFTHVADDTRGEDLVRALAAVSRNEIMVVDHVNTAAVLEKSVILGAISDAEKLGIAYREALAKGEDCVEAILRAGKGRRVFDGSIVAAEYETVDGYTYGSMRIANGEQQMEIRYQNENIVAILNGEILVTVPDLIIVMDKDAKYPVLNPYARVGMNVSVLCLPAPAVWTSEKGLAVFGPRFFGYDVEWRPFCQ